MGKLEQRAVNFCRAIERTGKGAFTVEEKPSRTWGYIPSISTHEGTAARASGCGYDKRSAVLAQFLGSLGGRIASTDAAGEAAVIAACREQGWELAQVGGSKRSTTYTITRLKP